ncbi:MAG: Holliday junction branch migration protein RuvA [bacterium]|nr:Holliday junction branch migration protein RuvA [bacterium]
MYDRLTGIIAVRDPAQIVLDVGGIGFSLTVPLSTFDRLPSIGAKATLYCYLHVREDQLALFGFASEDERVWFLRLIQLPGIGPKLAISILSGIRIGDFREAVLHGDVKRLKSISGVGEKLAQRIAMELRSVVGGSAPVAPTNLQPQAASIFQDAVLALEALGIVRATAEKNVTRVLQAHPDLPISEVVQKALSNG